MTKLTDNLGTVQAVRVTNNCWKRSAWARANQPLHALLRERSNVDLLGRRVEGSAGALAVDTCPKVLARSLSGEILGHLEIKTSFRSLSVILKYFTLACGCFFVSAATWCVSMCCCISSYVTLPKNAPSHIGPRTNHDPSLPGRSRHHHGAGASRHWESSEDAQHSGHVRSGGRPMNAREDLQ